VSCAQRMGLSTQLGVAAFTTGASAALSLDNGHLPNATVAPVTPAVFKKLRRFMAINGFIMVPRFLPFRCLPHRPSGGRQVGELHFRVLARENQSVRSGFQSGGYGGIGVLGRGFAAVLAGRDANVDAG